MPYNQNGEWVNEFGEIVDMQERLRNDANRPPSFQPALVESPQEKGVGMLAQKPPAEPKMWNPQTIYDPTTGGQKWMPENPITISGVGNRMMIQDPSIPSRPAIDEYGNPVSLETIKKIQSNLGEAPISEEDRKYLGVREPSEMEMKLADFETVLRNQNQPEEKIKGALALAANELMKAEIAKQKTTGEIQPLTGNLRLNEKGVAPDALQGLTPDQANTVKAIAEYRFPVTNLRNKEVMKLVERAYSYAPDFDVKEYKKRQDLLKSYTSGPAAENLKSMNTLVGHLDTLDKDAKALDNGDTRFWNWVRNATTEELKGDPRYAAFRTSVNAVATELAKTFKGGTASATDQETEEWRKDISTSKSPAALRKYVEKAAELMESRFMSQYDAYLSGMGKIPDMQLLKPRTIETLKKLGVGQKMLAVSGEGSQPNVEQPRQSIPQAAIDLLRKDPSLIDAFEAKYGKGSASALGR